MQELIHKQTNNHDEVSLLSNINEAMAKINMESEKNCLKWIIQVPEWIIDFLHSHELYNQIYSSIGRIFSTKI